MICGAKTRAGTPCKRRDLYCAGRCEDIDFGSVLKQKTLVKLPIFSYGHGYVVII